MDKLRIGVIGAGSVVREIYQHLYYNSEYSHLISIDAVASPTKAHRDEFCDKYNIPQNRRFASYEEMIDNVELDAVQVNTPDSLHEKPTIYALNKGLDVMIPKPLADSVVASHNIIQAAKKTGRLIGVDFHKRDDPRIKECQARYRKGNYGQFQSAVWYMVDKLMVADPNHKPPFFATANYAETNSPISFLTVHMVDAFMKIIGLKPVKVRAHGWKQKLPSLKPIAVNGYDLCDTEIIFENGGVAHIITGWHIPNTAHSLTVQQSRIICTDGYVDLGLDTPGYHEVTPDGILELNPMFRNFDADGMVTGYGMSRPGRIYQKFLKSRNGDFSDKDKAALLDNFETGFWTSVVLEAAEESLKKSSDTHNGVTHGVDIAVSDLLQERLGDAANLYV